VDALVADVRARRLLSFLTDRPLVRRVHGTARGEALRSGPHLVRQFIAMQLSDPSEWCAISQGGGVIHAHDTLHLAAAREGGGKPHNCCMVTAPWGVAITGRGPIPSHSGMAVRITARRSV